MGSRTVGWLVLALLALAPLSASAQPVKGPTLGSAAWDFLCLSGEAPCLKFRAGLLGGGILATKPALAAGLQGSVLLHLGESIDIGATFLFLADPREEEETYVGFGGGLLRIVLLRDSRYRLLTELSGGVAEVHEATISRANASGGLGLAFEVGGQGAGGFLNAGLHLAQGEHLIGLPYAGLGLFF